MLASDLLLPSLTQEIAHCATKIQAQLPTGWNMAVVSNTITVSREKPIEWYGTISLPHNNKAELKALGFVHPGTYTIRVDFGQPVTEEAREKLLAENKRIISEYYSRHPRDPPSKPSPPPKEVRNKLHRIPNILTARYSALVTPFIQDSMAFYDASVEAECSRVERMIREVVGRKPAR
jgi:hypothetical protein